MNNNFIADLKEVFIFDGRYRSVLYKAYTMSSICILIGLLPMPYEFYMVLRFILCVSIYLFIRQSVKIKGLIWTKILAVLMVLYNPIIVVHLGFKLYWVFINICTFYLLYRARLRLELNA